MDFSDIKPDLHRETILPLNRKVWLYERQLTDNTSPILVEYYKKNDKFEPLDPIIANAIVLDYGAYSFITTTKKAKQASHFVVFKRKWESTTKYINCIDRFKDVKKVLKLMIENDVEIIECETIEDFSNYDSTPPVIIYEDLEVSLSIDTTKTTTLYLDETTPVKCSINWAKGEKDWFVYRYKWDFSSKNKDTVDLEPNGRRKVEVSCEVEFRLKNEPNNLEKIQKFTVSKVFNFEEVPEPKELELVASIICPEAVDQFLVDHTYRFTVELSCLSSGYVDWEIESITWNIPDTDPSIYQTNFTPKEEKEYEITVEVKYHYKRKPIIKKSFFASWKKKAKI